MALHAFLINTQHYQVRIKRKVKQSKEKSYAFPYTLVYHLMKREPLGYP